MTETTEHTYIDNPKIMNASHIQTQGELSGDSAFSSVDFSNFSLSKGFRLFNFTSHVICAVDRAGVVFDIDPVYLPGFNGIVVISDYECHKSVKVDMGHLSNDNKLDEKLLKYVFGNPVLHRDNYFSSLAYVYKSEIFGSDKNSYYLKEFDIQLSMGASTKVKPIHPFTEKGILSRYSTNVSDPSNGSSNLSFLLVDNEQRYNTRYININGEILKVNPVKNNELSDGFYFHICGNGNVNNNGKGKIHYQKLGEIDNLDSVLFRSPDEALHYGDRKHKAEIEKIEKEAEKAKKELELENIKYKSRLKEFDNKIKELEAKVQSERLKTKELEEQSRIEKRKAEDQILFEERKNQMKDHYESRSYSRKDSNDSLKTVGAVAASVLSLAMLWSKFG